jgi:hypothetical protein
MNTRPGGSQVESQGCVGHLLPSARLPNGPHMIFSSQKIQHKPHMINHQQKILEFNCPRSYARPSSLRSQEHAAKGARLWVRGQEVWGGDDDSG